MTRALMICIFLVPLVAGGFAWAEDGEETVPKTYDGAGDAFQQSGKQFREGFQGLGRGLRDTFTGKPAKEDYKETKKIGEGFKDVGRGIAGGARAVGESVEESVEGDEPADD